MQKITPCLWFEKDAEKAAEFYTSLFPHAAIGAITRYDEASANVSGQKEGSVLTVSFTLEGLTFTGLNGGPLFKFTPAVSFLIACQTPEEVDGLWTKLIEGGRALMELNSYPFSEKYGWLVDKYGLSWQIMATGERPITQKIVPTLMFTQGVAGKAQEAINLYTSLFANSSIGSIMRYGKGEEPDGEGTIKHAGFTLNGQEFAAMDSAQRHEFTFTEAISFEVDCADQKEIDEFWASLSRVSESEQCGWLKDTYGLSWQIVPTELREMLSDKDSTKSGRAMKAMLAMKKLDIAKLRVAYEGK